MQPNRQERASNTLHEPYRRQMLKMNIEKQEKRSPQPLNPQPSHGTPSISPSKPPSNLASRRLVSTSITLEACFPSSASLPQHTEHLSLHTSLSFSLQEAALNFNHAGSVLSVIRRACAYTILTACRGAGCAAEPCTHSCTSTCTFSVL